MAEGNLTGPEGILLLCVAGLLDSIGFVLFLFSWLGIDDYGALDIIGAIVIGGWLFIRTGSLKSTKGAQDVAKKTLKRFGFTSLVELVPFLGSISPSWTILVWKELKE